MFTGYIKRRKAVALLGGAILTFAALFAAIPLRAQDRRVELPAVELTVGEAFREIEHQTGYRFAYNSGILDTHRPVRLSSTGMEVADLLGEILEGTGLSAVINDRHIVIVRQQQTAAERQTEATAAAATAQRSGTASRMPGMDALENSFRQKQRLPRFALKINLPYAATATFNLALETRLSDRLTLDVPVGYNPWTFAGDKKFKHLAVQPELRLWINEPFNGHFLGLHLHYALFNVGELNLPLRQLQLADRRYQGDIFGAGISYGYQMILSNCLSLEANVGIGYARLDYQEYDCDVCGRFLGWGSRDYFGITRMGISLVWIIR